MSTDFTHEQIYGSTPLAAQAQENTATAPSPDWNSWKWRNLNKGEIIEKKDWVDAAPDGWRDDPIWKPATCVGQSAPDPLKPAHRIYRRLVA